MQCQTIDCINCSEFWQAYTLELEAEVAKLKEMNEELLRKQVSTYHLDFDSSYSTETLVDGPFS